MGLTKKIPRKHLAEFIKKNSCILKTLDIGSGGSPYGSYFPNRISVDIAPVPGVDIIANAEDLNMFTEGEFGCVLATEVLEHIKNPEKAISEFYRVLKKNGKLVLTTRFIFPIHDAPNDYWRFTRYGLEHLLRRFERIELTEEVKTLGTIAVLFERIGLQCETLYFKPLSVLWLIFSKLIEPLSGIITREYGDVRHSVDGQHIMTSGYYVVAIK